ncbi:MAG TPA: MgtC/SapB family protein [Meiothermus sp.]|nr:MgtC/SapB family protein [Meiothermus sp.]
MQETQALWHLLAAVLVGFAVGLERERARTERQASAIGGLRTFTLIGLLGGASALVKELWLVPVGLVAIGALGVYSLSRSQDATSPVAALTVYVLGVLCGLGVVLPALFAGVLTVAFLTFREELHKFVGGLSRQELEAGILLALLLGVIYPLLPDEAYGPYQVWNPREIWMMVVLVAGVNFAGYLALRFLGQRGLWVAALFGGLVSSTAVTLSMASRARAAPSRAPLWASGVAVASQVMLLRVAFWVGLFAPDLLGQLLIPLVVWLVWGLLVALWLARRDSAPPDSLPVRSPLELTAALSFALVYAVVKLLAAWGTDMFGNAGLYIVSALSGLTDVDAITLSVARLNSSGELALSGAVLAVLLAVLANTLVKAGLAFGGGRLGQYVAVGLLPGGVLALLAYGLFAS